MTTRPNTRSTGPPEAPQLMQEQLNELNVHRELRQLLKFIKDYARKALPLTELLKKEEKFTWNPERQLAFEELKLTLSRAPILSPPN